MSDTPTTNNVRSTSVKITLNAKSLGLDAFITFEESVEFPELTDTVTALVKREEMSSLITDQLLAIIKDTAATVKSAAPVSAPAFVPTQAAAPLAPAGTGANAIMAVANGAAVGGEWSSAPDRFDANKQVRFRTVATYSQDQFKADVSAWLMAQGFNPQMFEIWDERGDAEKGIAVSSLANVKVKKEFHHLVPTDVVATPRGGNKAIIRVKFNNDGSLWCYMPKEVEAANKYGALNNLKLGAAPATAAPSSFDLDEEEAF
jgi:hypothetical protein